MLAGTQTVHLRGVSRGSTRRTGSRPLAASTGTELRPSPWTPTADPLLKLLERFEYEGVKYILVGGHAVRLNGFLRSTEDVDILLPASIENGRRVIRALNFLPSAAGLQPEWFASSTDEPENIRIAGDLLIDLLFAANGESYESLQAHARTADRGRSGHRYARHRGFAQDQNRLPQQGPDRPQKSCCRFLCD